MKFILAFLFFAEVFFIGFHFGSAHFGREYDFLPTPVPASPETKLITEKKALETRLEEVKEQSRDPLISNFERKRDLEIEKLKLARKIASIVEIIKKPPKDENGEFSTIRKTDLQTVKQNYQETFINLNPGYGISWFGNFFLPPSPVRILICAPLLLFPIWLIFFSLRRFIAPASSESRFATFVKKGQTEKAISLWNSGAVQHNFRQMPDGLQKKWFKLLCAKSENEKALEWGTILYHKNPADRAFAREFGLFLLQKCRIVDLKYAGLYFDLLSHKKDIELARLIATEGLLKYQDAELEEGVLKLARLIQNICPLPELAKMLKERNVSV
jgi:hypothetical protein